MMMDRAAIDAMMGDPKKAIALVTKHLTDTYELHGALLSDLDIHSTVAARILRKKRSQVTLVERQTFKEYSFRIRYGGFNSVPGPIFRRYEKLFPALIALGLRTRADNAASRAANKARFEAMRLERGNK